jgi:prepilin-type N-terminal cleavage/methylation domain-containing protein/prepilin-type processing-associated H-X9-DG protein
VSRPARNGFTLIELVVVIVIIVILIGLMLPAVRRVRDPANRMSCMNNLHQLALALAQYESGTGTSASAPAAFPPGCMGPGATPEERLSWMVALPYLEQDAVYRKIDLAKGYEGNASAVQTRFKVFLCPTWREAKEAATPDAVTNYIAMAGIGLDAPTRPAGAPGNGFMGYDRVTSYSMIKDGSSNTIALMETHSGLGPWARGGSSNVRGFDAADVPLCGDERPFAGHESGMNAAMADGSVHFILSSVDPSVLAAANTIDGGERVANLD